MSEKYITVSNSATAEITEKKSRFIANVCPVKTEEEALSFLAETRKKYSDARHNVYAYSVRENNIARFSDDGEPAQTAGLPIMDLINKEGITDVCVVVTRYFGGILLGTGGLVRAYTKSAKEGLSLAEPVIMQVCREIGIECDYTLLGKIQARVIERGYEISEPVYSDKVTLFLYVPAGDAEDFSKDITDLSNGEAKIILGETAIKPQKINNP